MCDKYYIKYKIIKIQNIIPTQIHWYTRTYIDIFFIKQIMYLLIIFTVNFATFSSSNLIISYINIKLIRPKQIIKS